MSLHGPTALVLRAGLSGRWWSSAREFFAYHGVWAFGVRALRLWSLRMKMVLLVTVMSLPLLPLMVQQIVDRNATVQSSAMRLHGPAGERRGLPPGRAAGPGRASRWSRASRPAQWKAADLALQQLSDAVAGPAAQGLPLEAAWQSRLPLLERALNDRTQSPASRLAVLDGARQALTGLRQLATTESQVCC